MIVSDIIEKAEQIIQDPSVEDNYDLLGLANRCVNEIAAGGPASFFDNQAFPPLPDLYKIGTVTVAPGAISCSLPDDFMRKVVLVFNSNGEEVNLYDSFLKFVIKNPGLSAEGDIYSCAVKGSFLYVQGAPASVQDLTVHYYRNPVEMTDSSEPDGLPSHMHERIIVPYICKEVFSGIEDGMEGRKTNTDFHEQLYLKAVRDLSAFIGPEDVGPQYIGDETDYS